MLLRWSVHYLLQPFHTRYPIASSPSGICTGSSKGICFNCVTTLRGLAGHACLCATIHFTAAVVHNVELLPAMAQEFLPGLRAAEEQQDDIGACPLQWMYCQLLLFKSSCGHNVEVSAFLGEMLKVNTGCIVPENGLQCTSCNVFLAPLCSSSSTVKVAFDTRRFAYAHRLDSDRRSTDSLQARRMKAQLDSWGNFPCSQTGGSTPVQSIPLAAQYNYWSCLGMVARLKEAIRLDPALADTNLPAYTRQEIAEAMDHVRRATDLFCAVNLALLVAVGQEPSLWQ